MWAGWPDHTALISLAWSGTKFADASLFFDPRVCCAIVGQLCTSVENAPIGGPG
jgi:hypothetical protein